MGFNPTDLSWTLEGEANTFQMGETRQAIYDALREADEPKGPKWLAGEVDHDYDNVSLTYRDDNREYELPDCFWEKNCS